MSKRKDIEYIHNVKRISYKEARRLYHDNGDDLIKSLGLKGISYKEARRLYHDNGDDLIKSLGFDYSILKAFEVLGEGLSEAIDHIAEAAYKIGEAISEIVNNIDWDEVARTYNEAKRELEDNSIEIPDTYFNEED